MKIQLNTRYVVTKANSDNSINIGDAFTVYRENTFWAKYSVIIPHQYKGNIHNQVFYFATDEELIKFIVPLELTIDKDFYLLKIQQLKKQILQIKRLCYES